MQKKKIVFIWNFPRVLGISIVELLSKRRVETYCKTLNEYFAEHEMDCQVFLDDTCGDIDELLKEEYAMFLFLPGGETRFWAYRKEIEKSNIPVYYLTEMELYQNDISKVIGRIPV